MEYILKHVDEEKFLTCNGKLTTNINKAYTYSYEGAEQVRKALTKTYKLETKSLSDFYTSLFG